MGLDSVHAFSTERCQNQIQEVSVTSVRFNYYFKSLNLSVLYVLVTTKVIKSNLLGGAGYGLMFLSDYEDNEDVLICTLEGVLKNIGLLRYQKDRR